MLAPKSLYFLDKDYKYQCNFFFFYDVTTRRIVVYVFKSRCKIGAHALLFTSSLDVKSWGLPGAGTSGKLLGVLTSGVSGVRAAESSGWVAVGWRLHSFGVVWEVHGVVPGGVSRARADGSKDVTCP